MSELVYGPIEPYLREAFILIFRSEPPPFGASPRTHPLRVGWYGLAAIADGDPVAGIADIFDACMEHWSEVWAENCPDLQWPETVPRRWADASQEFRVSAERLRRRAIELAIGGAQDDLWERPPALTPEGHIIYQPNLERMAAYWDAFIAKPDPETVRLMRENCEKHGFKPEDERVRRIVFPEDADKAEAAP